MLLLIGFGVLVAGAARIAIQARPPRVLRIIRDTLHTTGQLGVRASILLLALLVFLAADAGFEFVLGAFAAGLVVGLALDSPDGRVVRRPPRRIGFGFLVPVYFVVTGMNFDLDSLLTAGGLALAGLFLAMLLVSRGASAVLWLRDLGQRRGPALRCSRATGLPLIVAIVGIGQEEGDISDSVGASLIGAGMLSVLVYPILGAGSPGRSRRTRSRRSGATPTSTSSFRLDRPRPTWGLGRCFLPELGDSISTAIASTRAAATRAVPTIGNSREHALNVLCLDAGLHPRRC